MKKLLSVVLAVCLVLSLFTSVFMSVPSARASTDGDFTYTLLNGEAHITGYTGQATNVTLPDVIGPGNFPVTGIDSFYCFTTGNTNINLTIPKGINFIFFNVLLYCSSVTVVPDNPSFSSLDGVLFNKDQTLLMAYPGGKSGTSYTIPSTVTSIGFTALASCNKLTSIIIPNGVIGIDDSAFTNCLLLTNITIPASVTRLGNDGKGLEVFSSCNNLININVDPANQSYASIDGVLFNKAKTQLIAYPTARTGAYTVPDGVQEIVDEAFFNCRNLTGITFPSSLTNIGREAFMFDAKLRYAHFLGNAPTDMKDDNGGTPIDMFRCCDPSFKVYYDSTTTGWGNGWYGYQTTSAPVPVNLQKVLVLQIGKEAFTVNGVVQYLDSPPIIENGRTLVPIRAVMDAIVGYTSWDEKTRKATVYIGGKNIDLWIGKSIAMVNGVSTPIDPSNPNVVPEIIKNRTMLPLRFVVENIGATVDWDQKTQTITITYTY
jgi:hypothetical protein